MFMVTVSLYTIIYLTGVKSAKKMYSVISIYFLICGQSTISSSLSLIQCFRAISLQLPVNHTTVVSYLSRPQTSDMYEKNEMVNLFLNYLQYQPSIVYNINSQPTWRTNTFHLGRYIIFISNDSNDENELNINLNSHLYFLVNSISLNPRAQFVIITAECAICGPRNTAKMILTYLWKWKIAKAIVLVSVGRSKNASYEMYTWFPYHEFGQCGKSIDIASGKWLIADRYVIKMNSLFKNNININTQGCSMRVSTITTSFFVGPPENEYSNSLNESKLVYSKGLEIQLLKLITQAMKMKDVYIPAPESPWILMDNDGNLTGYAKELYSDKADIAFGGLSMTGSTRQLTDVTHSYYWDKISWYVPCGIKYPRWKSLTRIFSTSLWVCFALSVLLTVIIVVRLSQTSGSKECYAYRSLLDTLSNTWAVIIGISITLPKSLLIRIFFGAWICYSFTINTVFQTYLTTYLIDPGYVPHFETLDQLINSDMKLGLTYFDAEIYNNSADLYTERMMKKIVDCTFKEYCIQWALMYKNLSIVFSTLYMDVINIVSSSQWAANGSNLLCRIEHETVNYMRFAMLMPKGSPLFPIVNNIVLRTMEAGLFNQWIEVFLHSLKIQWKMKIRTGLSEEYCELTLIHMQSPFYLMVLGYGISLFVFICEVILHHIWYNVL
ncbi:Ionotropic receptor 579 [Blattella germanica]|nr:Ionotropic receptor 579 [Blattella germanica]